MRATSFNLRIDQTFGKINLKQSDLVMRLQSKQPEVEMITKKDILKIEQRYPEVKISFEKAQADYGFLSPTSYSKLCADKGMYAVMQYISRTAQNGDELMNFIQPDAKTLIDQIKRQILEQDEIELNIDYLDRPEIAFLTGEVEIDPPRDQIDFKWNEGTVKSDFQMGRIDIYLKQKPEIEFQMTGSLFDLLA